MTPNQITSVLALALVILAIHRATAATTFIAGALLACLFGLQEMRWLRNRKHVS